MEVIYLRDEFIKLGQALKAAGFVDSGVEAKEVIQEGLVLVNGEVSADLMVTKGYTAPEDKNGSISRLCDIYSLGDRNYYWHFAMCTLSTCILELMLCQESNALSCVKVGEIFMITSFYKLLLGRYLVFAL